MTLEKTLQNYKKMKGMMTRRDFVVTTLGALLGTYLSLSTSNVLAMGGDGNTTKSGKSEKQTNDAEKKIVDLTEVDLADLIKKYKKDYPIGGDINNFEPANEAEEFFRWYILDFVTPLIGLSKPNLVFIYTLAKNDKFVFVSDYGKKLDYEGWVKNWTSHIGMVTSIQKFDINKFKVEWPGTNTAKVYFTTLGSGTVAPNWDFKGERDYSYVFERLNNENTYNAKHLDYFFGEGGVGGYLGRLNSRWIITKIEETPFRSR